MTQRLLCIWAQARNSFLGKPLSTAGRSPTSLPDSLPASSGTFLGFGLGLGFLCPTPHLRYLLPEDGFGPKHRGIDTEQGPWGMWPLRQEMMSVRSVMLNKTREGIGSHGACYRCGGEATWLCCFSLPKDCQPRQPGPSQSWLH